MAHQPLADAENDRGDDLKHKEILGRITGISCPIFGVSWDPPSTDRSIAGRIITFLEDRRVLYAPSEVEIPRHCIVSVIEIRRFLTDNIQETGEDSTLQNHLRALRAACRKFLDALGPIEFGSIDFFGPLGGGYQAWIFLTALGELRGTFGNHIAAIAASYGLDLEDDLASILPQEPDQGGREAGG